MVFHHYDKHPVCILLALVNSFSRSLKVMTGFVEESKPDTGSE